MDAVFFCLKGVFRESNFPEFRSDRTKLKPNESFNDFAISEDAINEINPNFFYFEDIARN